MLAYSKLNEFEDDKPDCAGGVLVLPNRSGTYRFYFHFSNV